MKTKRLLLEQSWSETPAAGTLPKVPCNGRAYIVDWQMADSRQAAKPLPPPVAGNTLPKPGEAG